MVRSQGVRDVYVPIITLQAGVQLGSRSTERIITGKDERYHAVYTYSYYMFIPKLFGGPLSNIANIELLAELTSRLQETWTTPNVHGKAGDGTSYKPL